MDKVSIIVPVYRVENYLRRAVDALLGQTYTNVEVILVDDGSPDGSGGICDSYQDPRVRVLHQKNGGVSAARNVGLAVAEGDWIAFCDGDDWFAPNMVESMLSCAQKEQADLVICDYQIVADGRPPMVCHSVAGMAGGCDARLVIATGSISSCTHLVKKALFDRAGVRYPEGIGQYEELPVMPVLAKHASRIAVVDAPLYNYYQRFDGSSASNAGASSAAQFRRAYGQMAILLGEGFENEGQYHAIYALLYGEVLRLCKAKAPAGEIKKAICEFEEEFPNWRENPYLPHFGRAKNLFLRLCSLRLITALRMLSWVHGKLVN